MHNGCEYLQGQSCRQGSWAEGKGSFIYETKITSKEEKLQEKPSGLEPTEAMGGLCSRGHVLNK